MSRCNIYKENVNFPFSEYFIWIMKKWVVMKKYCWWERLPPLCHPRPPCAAPPPVPVQPPAQHSLLWSIILTKCYVLPLNSKNPWKINIFMLVLYSWSKSQPLAHSIWCWWPRQNCVKCEMKSSILLSFYQSVVVFHWLIHGLIKYWNVEALWSWSCPIHIITVAFDPIPFIRSLYFP